MKLSPPHTHMSLATFSQGPRGDIKGGASCKGHVQSCVRVCKKSVEATGMGESGFADGGWIKKNKADRAAHIQADVFGASERGSFIVLRQ